MIFFIVFLSCAFVVDCIGFAKGGSVYAPLITAAILSIFAYIHFR